jgi:osmotically-inducible protein OsmY
MTSHHDAAVRLRDPDFFARTGTREELAAAAEYKVAKDKCSGMSGNAKDVCKEEAKVARARMEADAVAEHRADNSRDLQRAREKVAKAEYSLAKEKCDDMSGDAKSSCIKEAKAAETTAIADARSNTGTAAVLTDRSTTTTTTTTTGAATAAGTAADRTAAAAARAGDRTAAATEKAGDVASDAMITTKVKADFAADDQVKAMDVHVETVKGVVMLSGFVDSKAEADKAVELARKVKGVSDVKSTLQVKK